MDGGFLSSSSPSFCFSREELKDLTIRDIAMMSRPSSHPVMRRLGATLLGSEVACCPLQAFGSRYVPRLSPFTTRSHSTKSGRDLDKEIEEALKRSSNEVSFPREVEKASREAVRRVHAEVDASRKEAAALTAQARKERYRQATFNGLVAFFTVLMAGQSLKSGIFRRQADRKAEAVEELLEEKRLLLAAVRSEDSVRQLARDCVEEIQAERQKSERRWRWGGDPESAQDVASLEDRIVARIHSHFDRLVGDASLTDQEKDQQSFEHLRSVGRMEQQQQQQSVQVVESDVPPVLVEDDAEAAQVDFDPQQVRVEKDVETGEKVVRKTVFRI